MSFLLEVIGMKKPLIGVVPLWDSEKNCYWMLPNYMQGIEKSGGIPVMLPLTEDEEIIKQLVNTCDGFLFTGGQDVDPKIYNEVRTKQCGESCTQRDNMETELFRLAYEKDKSILGICRGIQFINAVMGGTLYRDLQTEHPTYTVHHQPHPYDKPIHSVKIMKNSPLHKLLNTDALEVTSLHHQAVKDIAPNFECMAVSEDGLIEALFAPDKKFVWAVQWHPEYSFFTDENSRKIFKKFTDSVS